MEEELEVLSYSTLKCFEVAINNGKSVADTWPMENPKEKAHGV